MAPGNLNHSDHEPVKTRRLFIGLFPEADACQQITDYVSNLSGLEKNNITRWQPAENLHITLKFFGQTLEHKIPDIISCMKAVALTTDKPMQIQLNEAVVFPNNRHPKVLALGATVNDSFKQLVNDLEKTLTNKGFQKSNYIYHPHMTIARVKHHAHIDVPKQPFRLDLNVRQIDLVESITYQEGAKYQLIERVQMAEPAT
jgi:RNA 2',3'-cyclic 3'-phosphodiesterase